MKLLKLIFITLVLICLLVAIAVISPVLAFVVLIILVVVAYGESGSVSPTALAHATVTSTSAAVGSAIPVVKATISALEAAEDASALHYLENPKTFMDSARDGFEMGSNLNGFASDIEEALVEYQGVIQAQIQKREEEIAAEAELKS